MASSLTATLGVKLGWRLSETVDFSSVNDVAELAHSMGLTQGTAADLADLLWYDSGVVASSGSPTVLNLNALTRVFAGSTLTTNFVKVKAIVLANLSETAAEYINVGANGTTPFVGMFNGVSASVIQVAPKAALALSNPLSGWSTSGANLLKLAVPSGTNVPYKIGIIGTSA
jgi:hypothetical protein